MRELKLERFLVELGGNELTTDTSKKPWGHANVFPLVADPSKPRGGAPRVRDVSARDIFAEVRKNPSPFVLQINHPRTNITGYFDQMHFDPATGTSTDAEYDPGFDAVEVWNGRNVDGREKVLKDFLGLVANGHPVTPTADTDTHGIVGYEAGYPRTYVRVATAGALDTWDAGRSADLVKGVREARDVVLTNGPFLRVSANGAPIGGVVKLLRGARKSVNVKVHVESAPWVKVDTLEIVRASGGVLVRPITPALGASGALVGDVTIPLVVDGDDAFIVIARGTAPLAPVLAGDAREIAPWAMTGAIWIDADGDGKSLGR